MAANRLTSGRLSPRPFERLGDEFEIATAVFDIRSLEDNRNTHFLQFFAARIGLGTSQQAKPCSS